MRVVEFENVVRKDSHIYYRREFKADAKLEIMARTLSVPIEFVLEHKPTGSIEVTATLREQLDYPVLPIVNKLKEYIAELEKRRALP